MVNFLVGRLKSGIQNFRSSLNILWLSNGYDIKILLLGVLLSSILSTIILRNFLFSDGYILNAECIGVSPFFSERVQYLWDPLYQSENRAETATRYALFSFLGPQLSHFFVLTLMGCIAFFVVIKLTANTLNSSQQYVVGTIATLFYMTNPIMANEVFRISYVWAMAWTPLLFYLAYTYLRKVGSFKLNDLVKRAFFLSIILSFLADPFWLIASAILLLFCFAINIKKPYRPYFLNSIKLLLFSVIFWVLLSLWWILPYFNQALVGVSLPVPYVMTWENAQMLSQNASFLNVFRLMWYWLSINSFTFPEPLSIIYFMATVILPLLAFSSIIIKRSKLTISVGILTLFVLALSTGLYYSGSLGEIYGWILFNFPVWFPRSPGRWQMVITFLYMLLIGFSFTGFLEKIKKIKMSNRTRKNYLALLVGVFTIPLIISGFPLTLNAPMTSQSLPDDYVATNQWLEEMTGDFKILAIPDKPLWGYPISTVNSPWLVDILVNGNHTFQFSALLKLQNIKFVLLDCNMLSDAQISNLNATLMHQNNLNYLISFGNISLFEVKNPSSVLEIADNIILSDGGLAYATSLAHTANNSSSYTILLQENLQNAIMLESSQMLSLQSSAMPLLVSSADGISIVPSDDTNHHNPSQMWSIGATNDPLNGPWHDYLESLNIDNSDLDYGKDLVFTWATSNIENPEPTENDLIDQWTFDSAQDFYQWKNLTSENTWGTLYSITVDSGALRVNLWNSTWGWKIINSPLVSADYDVWYRLQLDVKAQDIQSGHIKVVEYDKDNNVLSSQQVYSLGSGSFDWQNVILDYKTINPDVCYIQLQVWHGYETSQPLPNTIRLDNVKVYNIQRFAQPITLDISFTVSRAGEYEFFVRLFKNQAGGAIQIQIDGKNYTITTKDQLNSFVWESIDCLYLEKGQHEITLTNIEGFNAVNLFDLISTEQYIIVQNQIQQTIENKTLLYMLDAETNLYRQNTQISNKYGSQASNGMVLELSEASYVYNVLDILQTGNYAVAIHSKGDLTITIDKQTYSVTSTELNWNYIGPINLQSGNCTVEIVNPTSGSLSDLDEILFYSTRSLNQTIPDLFSNQQSPANVIFYQKINPTKYVVEVNASAPFMLSFAESYDPLWVATVNGKQITSTSLYSVINGFWINETGQLYITIEYQPQKWFYYGSIISVSTLLVCGVYLALTLRNKALLKKIKTQASNFLCI